MSVLITNDNNNLLLGRREIRCSFQNTQNLKKQTAIQFVKDKLKSKDDFIIPIKLLSMTGLNTINGIFYIYNDRNSAEKQVNKHILSRLVKNAE